MTIVCARDQGLSAEDYSAVIGSTYMADRRPIANRARIERMLAGSNLIVTARAADGTVLGLARGITDGEWVCYIADLAVREGSQGRGLGTALLDECTRILGPGIGLVLLAYPPAEDFYRRIGLGEMAAFYRDRRIRT